MKKYGHYGMYYYALSETNKFFDSYSASDRVYWRNPEIAEKIKDKRNSHIAYILSFYDKEGRQLPWVKVGETKIGSNRWVNLINSSRAKDTHYIVIEYIISFPSEDLSIAMESDFRYYYRQYKGGIKDGKDYCKNITFNNDDLKNPMFNQLIRSNLSKMFAARY